MCDKEVSDMEKVREAVTAMEGQVAGLVLSLKNLEEHVMPAVMERLNRVERDEGKKAGGKEYIEEAEEAEGRMVKAEEIKEEVQEVTKGEEPKEMGLVKEEQAEEEPKELGGEKAGQVREDGDKETLEEDVGEEPSRELTVREVWEALKREDSGAGSQDSRFKRERRVEQLMRLDPRAGPVLRVLGPDRGVDYCLRFQGSVLAEMQLRIRERATAKVRRSFRDDARFCQDRMSAMAESMQEGGSLLLLDKVGGAAHLQGMAGGKMERCPRKKDNMAALRQIGELIEGRPRKDMGDMAGEVVDRALDFARGQVSMGMSQRWPELVSLGGSLARVACGAILVLVDELEMVTPEAAWGKKAKAAVSGLAVGCSVLGKSGVLRKQGGIT